MAGVSKNPALNFPIRQTILPDKTRAKDYVGIFSFGKQLKNFIRRVSEITVKCYQNLIAAVVCPGNAFLMRAANAKFLGPMDHCHAIVARRELIQNLTGAVWRIVIEKQDIPVEV